MSVFSEIKRRNVFRVAFAYAAVGWLLIQIVIGIEDPLRLPDWFDTTIIVLIAIGFPVALVLAWAFELTPQGIKLTESVKREASITRQTGRKLNHITVAVLALAVSLLLVDRFYFQGGANTYVESAESSVLPNSIAVLPLQNLSPNEEDAYFAIGLHEEILNQLAKLRNLNVINRTTMSLYENSDMSLEAIAKELNVETVMEGNVRYANGFVRVTTQLINGQNGVHLWSETYEDQFENIFEIESDIAMNIANAMVVEFSEEEQVQIEEVPTDNANAYALYLESLSLSARNTAESIRLAIDKIDQALLLDPEFALGWQQKAWVHFNAQVWMASEMAFHLEQTEIAAQRAIDLDPDLGSAHAALASVYASRGDLLKAEETNRIASALGGSTNSFISLSAGHLQSSLQELRRARELDPNFSNIYLGIMLSQEALADIDAALTTYEYGKTLFGAWRGGDFEALTLFLALGDQSRVAAFVQRDDVQLNSIETEITVLLDEPAAALDRLHELYVLGTDGVAVLSVASLAAYLGDQQLSWRAMQGAIDAFSLQAMHVWRPLFFEVRQLDAFKTYMREKGYVEYWQQYGWPDLCEPLGESDFVCS